MRVLPRPLVIVAYPIPNPQGPKVTYLFGFAFCRCFDVVFSRDVLGPGFQERVLPYERVQQPLETNVQAVPTLRQGAGGMGQGTCDKGQGTGGMGQGTCDRGQRTRGMGQGTRDMGKGTWDM